jgi:diguanylate cyclase (GGDEF)-like protein
MYAENYSIDGEQLHFRRLSAKDGLPSVYINTLTQRKNGLIWIGTKAGLARFDGQNMSNYHYIPNDTNSLASDDITSLYEDNLQKLWIGTSKGLFLFNDFSNNFSAVPLSNDEKEPIIFHLSQDANNNYWVGTGDGVFVLNKELKVIWKGFEDKSIKFIGQSHPKKMWIASKQGVMLINPTTFATTHLTSSHLAEKIYFDELSVYDGLIDESTLWLATNKDGLIKIDTHKNEITAQYSTKNELISDRSIWSLAKSGDELWLGYFYDGISRFNTKTTTNLHSSYHPQIDDTISYNNVSKIFIDNSGLLWVGTTNGLSITDPKSSLIRQLGEYQNITNKHVWSIAKHKDEIWFGTEDGLNRFNLSTNKLTTYPSSKKPNTLPRTVLWSIYPDENWIWLGTNQGLIKYDFRENKSILFENDVFKKHRIYNESVYTLTGKEDELLLGYFNGAIAKFDTKNEKFKDTVLNVSKSYITNIVPVEDEYLIGSQQGIAKVVQGNVVNILTNHQIANHHITSMKLINEKLWVATLNNGLFILDKKNEQWNIAKHLTIDDNLPENTIKSILINKEGVVWLTGRKAIYQINPIDFEVTLFTSKFHWLDMEFHDNAVNPTQDDTIIFAGNEGLIFFSSNTLSKQTFFPALKLSSMQITNKKYNTIAHSRDITIPPDESFYSFNVSALEFLSPESIKYKYKLTPGQEEWQNLNNSKITLSNLPYDKYQLHLKSTNSDQVFSKDELKINLTVTPPFWWSAPAKALYSIVIILLIALTILSHKSKLKRMTFKARHDALTGLPNRDYLIYELEMKLENAARNHYKVAVLFFDLNGFKFINDTYGHDAGDKLLQHVAKQINNCIREKDFFARQSGDEFILILDNIYHKNDISQAIDRILTAFNLKFSHDGKEIAYGSSIGISIYDGITTSSAEELIKQADSAMYQCKKDKSLYCYYNE